MKLTLFLIFFAPPIFAGAVFVANGIDWLSFFAGIWMMGWATMITTTKPEEAERNLRGWGDALTGKTRDKP